MKVGFYAGSFDPFTVGHLHLVKVSSKLFDKVIIGMGVNSKKTRRFNKELMKQGIAIEQDYRYQTQYEFTLLNDLKPIMVEEATANARSVAQKFADDSKSKLNGIRQARQGQFSISSDPNTPQLKKVRVVTTIDYFLK